MNEKDFISTLIKLDEEAAGIKKNFTGHGYISWKSTDVCMEIYCKCGEHLHMDGTFFSSFTCLHCQRVYWTGSFIKLIEVPENFKEKLQERNTHWLVSKDKVRHFNDV
jgi:hypothetical protein